MSTLAERIQEILDAGFTLADLQRAAGVSKGTPSQWLSGDIKSMKLQYAKGIQTLTGFRADWIVTGALPKKVGNHFGLQSADQTDQATGQIEYWDAKGSCGGGFTNYDQLPKGHLVKEAGFFAFYGLKPENAFAIYADGDSMADFIVSGDIVIFDRSKTEPISGEIFAIEHPDGLRIKTLRRAIDGSWLLESRNPDKRAYPDERISPEQGELLKILGKFVYRQGGYK